MKIEPFSESKYELSLPKNCKIKKAILKVTGREDRGTIKPDSPGISSMLIGKDPSKQFIIDFHAFRNIHSVTLTVANQNVTVRQWGGIKFLDEDIKGFSLVKTEKILVTLSGAVTHDIFKKNFTFVVANYPSNLTLCLGDESPFWSYPGELTKSVIVPDFSGKLKDYIDACKSKYSGTVPLILRSDSPGNLEITESIDYNLLWDEYAVEKITFDGIENKQLVLEIKSSRGVLQLGNITFNYIGNFSNEFIDDNLSDCEEKVSIKTSTGKSIGLKIQTSVALKATGIDLYLLKKSKDVTLFVELVEDRNGKPTEELVLTSKKVKLSSQPSDHGTWVPIRFDDIVPLDKEKIYWLILKVGIGEIEWFCSTPENLKRPGGFIFRKESSTLWIPYPATGYFRLKYLPESGDILPINIKILDRMVNLKPTMESQSAGINFEDTKIAVNGKAQVNLEIMSKTSGELVLSDIVIEGKEV
jgi:hypothetical protein